MKKRLSILYILSLLASACSTRPNEATPAIEPTVPAPSTDELRTTDQAAATLKPTAMPIPATTSSTSVPTELPSMRLISPTSQPSLDVVGKLSIISFAVLPNPVERGSDLRIAWQADGALRIALWQMTYDSKLGRWYRQGDPISTGSATGEYRLTVPPDANRTLRFELEATDAIGNSETATSDEIRLVCYPIFFDLPWTAWCPNPPQTTPAAFQAFEGGYMIWRADTDQVYTLLQPAGPELPPAWFAFLPRNEAVQVDAPPNRYPPGEHFRRAWMSLTEHWRSLGWGVAPEQTFNLTAQLSLSSGDAMSQNDDLYLSWPDGRIAHLLVYLGTPNHASGPSWFFVGSTTTPIAIPPTASATMTYRVSGLP